MIVHTHTEYWSFSCDFTNLTNLHYSLEHLTFHCTSFRFFSFFFFLVVVLKCRYFPNDVKNNQYFKLFCRREGSVQQQEQEEQTKKKKKS